MKRIIAILALFSSTLLTGCLDGNITTDSAAATAAALIFYANQPHSLTSATPGDTSNNPSATTLSKPIATPSSGTFSSDQSVTLYTSEPGAEIRYTLDGSTPTSVSSLYTSPISITGNGTHTVVTAIAKKSGMIDSTALTTSYTINYSQASTPQISPISGSYDSDQSVTITTATSGANIYYTLDGSTPTTSSSLYSGAINISGNGVTKTVKAIATKSGMTNSTVVSETISIAYTAQVATPVVTPTSGLYISGQQITITSPTSGSTIYYTVDGSTPTTSSAVYTAAITLTTNTTVKAMAVKSGLLDSTVKSEAYTISATGYFVGGTVSGLTASDTVVLNLNGTQQAVRSVNGSFTFGSKVPNTGTYNVYVQTQPSTAYCIVKYNTGTVVGADVTNIVVTCPVVKIGTLYYNRCTFGQTWYPGGADCTGPGGTEGAGYGAFSAKVAYCNTADNSCNGGTNNGMLNGSGSSPLYQACQSMNTANGGTGTFGKTTWRVPTLAELEATAYCPSGYRSPAGTGCQNLQVSYVDPILFPNTPKQSGTTDAYFVAESSTTNAANVVVESGWIPGLLNKTLPAQVRCVAD